MNHSNYLLLKKLWSHLTTQRRRQFGLLLILIIISSFAEVFSIGAIIPFLGAITNPQKLLDSSVAQPLINLMGITSTNQLLLNISITFGLASLIAGALRLLLLWVSVNISYAAGADLSMKIYRRTLYQPYSVHVSRNSSEIINAISIKTNIVINTVTLSVLFVGSSIIFIAIMSALLAINPFVALFTFVGFGFIYLLIIQITKKKQLIYSQVTARESTQVIKALQEGLGGIRDILINGNQEAYCDIYQNIDRPYRKAQGGNVFLSQSPRYIVEALGLLVIAAIAYSLTQQKEGISTAIPILGALSLGAQRLLPLMQQAYSSWSIIKGTQNSIEDALELLDQPLPKYMSLSNYKPIQFKNEIKLNQLSFRYKKDSPWVLKNIELSIKKGTKIGVIGSTGSGKSTLLDILMGLLEATDGSLEIDGQIITELNNQSWQAHIAHVPQVIFLADATIEENIAFGVPKKLIDLNKVKEAAKRAQLSETIENMEMKYQTHVGERGVRLSGGQRQRIGIARALYKNADVIIFDEATSALDSATEESVMKEIDCLEKRLTILIIAHRLSTLKNCDQIIELADKKIRKISSYQDIVI